jgi:hypothetical protein
MSSGTKRSGPSSPPIRTDGIRPVRAASYTHARETASCRATSLGLRRSTVPHLKPNKPNNDKVALVGADSKANGGDG